MFSVSLSTPSRETLFVRFIGVKDFGREVRFAILDADQAPLSGIVATSRTLGTTAHEDPPSELAEAALLQNPLFRNLPQWLSAHLGQRSAREALKTAYLVLTTDGLTLRHKHTSH